MRDLATVKNVIFIIVVSCGGAFFTARPCFAQDQTLAISDVPLKIGMLQSNVLEALMDNLKVEKVQDNSSSYMVLDRKSVPVGAVVFENGRLTLVEKFWQAGEDVKGYDAAESMAAIFAQLEERGLTVASISTRMKREPNFTSSTSELRFAGNRKITISVWQFTGKAKSLQISESIFLK